LSGSERSCPLADRLGFSQEASTAVEQVFALGRQLDVAADAVKQRHA
jgi:hypothetical protein